MFRLLICHRQKRSLFKSRSFWFKQRAQLVKTLQAKLKFERYSQVHQVSRLNPLYLGILLSRSWLVTKIIALVQRRPISPSVADRPPREKLDVVEEFWFSSEKVLLEAITSSEGIEALKTLSDNLPNDITHSGIMFAKTLTIADAPKLQSGSITTLFFLGRTSDLTREQMLNHWKTSHAELVLSLQGELNFYAYDQLHAIEPKGLDDIAKTCDLSPLDYDGVADLMYSDQSVVGLSFLNPKTQIANLKLVSDEIRFIDGKHSVLVYGKRYVQ